MLKQHGHSLDPGAVPGASTKILLGRESFYGGELGSTGLKVTWSLPDDLVIDQTL